MIGIKYVAPVGDHSGYGEASRNYVCALHRRGVPITVFPRNFDPNPPPIADKEVKDTLDSLIDRRIPYDIVIIHLTPDLYPRYIEKDKYNIGLVAWETSSLHPKWVNAISSVDEIWVPCQHNVEALLDSGIKKPIRKIPHGIDPNTFIGLEDKKFNVKDLSDTTYKFYSIFQWTHRKNPEGLLRAYFNAFDEIDDVALIVKTYRTGNNRDKEFIRNTIIDIKKDMNIGYYPKVILIGDLLSKTQMMGLHLFGDAYVSLHRGEGWGLPMFEAGLAGNTVIATNYSGNLEYMTNENSYLIDSIPMYTSNMSGFNPWYLGNQHWAEPSTVHASLLMREVFDNREEARNKGLLLKKTIVENFSWDKVAWIIVERLTNL